MKLYLKIYFIVAGILLLFPPTYRQLPNGFVRKMKFPDNHEFLFETMGSWRLEIDWSILAIEFLLIAVVLIIVYLFSKENR